MAIVPARGPCFRCHQLNAYTRSTCNFCGERLLWADTFAATAGEECPICHHFNAYIRTVCESCNTVLPWAEAPAAKRFARGNVEAEQKPIVLVILFCSIAVIILFGFLIYSLTPK